jgi:glutathione peroxidase
MKITFTLCILLFSHFAYSANCPSILDRTITTLQGEKINLCQYAGKPILVVNTASKCGYTPQFEQLENMYVKYQAQGLLVLGFPSNDFKQELTSNGEIEKFCKLTYKVKFPMSEPSKVKGKDASPFYKVLARTTGVEPQWNFHKYLIAPDGKTIYSFPSEVEPDNPAILNKVVEMLK